MTTNAQFGIFDGPIPCRLEGWTHGTLNAWPTPASVQLMCGSLNQYVNKYQSECWPV